MIPCFVISIPSCSKPKPSTLASGRRDEQPGRLERLSALEVEPDPVPGRLDALRRRFVTDFDALLREPLREQLARLRVDPPQQVAVAVDDRHARARAVEELPELDADRPAAEHEERRRDLTRPHGLVVRPVADVLDPGDRRDRRRGAGRDDERVVLELAPLDLDDSGTGDARLAADERRALLLEPARVPGVVAAVRHLVAPPEHALEVELASHRLRGARREPGGGERLGGSQQRLRRDARVVRALPAREVPLDDRDLGLRVELPQRAHEVLAARPRAENDHPPHPSLLPSAPSTKRDPLRGL